MEEPQLFIPIKDLEELPRKQKRLASAELQRNKKYFSYIDTYFLDEVKEYPEAYKEIYKYSLRHFIIVANWFNKFRAPDLEHYRLNPYYFKQKYAPSFLDKKYLIIAFLGLLLSLVLLMFLI